MKRALTCFLLLVLVVGALFCSSLGSSAGADAADPSVVGVPDVSLAYVSNDAPVDDGTCSNNLGLSLDCAAVQDLIFSKGSFQLTGDFRVFVFDGFELRLPFGFSYAFGSSSGSKAGGSSRAGGSSLGVDGAFMFEFGALLVYYPWNEGPFMGLSLFQVGVTDGQGLLENLVNLNEVVFGWTFELGHGLFVEPALCIRDPSGTFSDEYSRIKGVFSCYGTFRFRLSFGWLFLEV